MFDTFAHLLSDADQALGHPAKEHLDPRDLTRAALKALALFGLISRQSEFGRTEKRIPVNLGSRENRVSNAPDMVVPLYLERRTNNANSTIATWDWIPMTRRATIEDAYQEGRALSSFYRDENNGLTISLSYDPAGYQHRLVYYTDPIIPGDREDPLPIPARYGYMITDKTVVNVVPMILVRSAGLEPSLQLNAAQLSALTAVVAHAQAGLADFEEPWKNEINADKDVRGGMRKRLVPRGY